LERNTEIWSQICHVLDSKACGAAHSGSPTNGTLHLERKHSHRANLESAPVLHRTKPWGLLAETKSISPSPQKDEKRKEERSEEQVPQTQRWSMLHHRVSLTKLNVSCHNKVLRVFQTMHI